MSVLTLLVLISFAAGAFDTSNSCQMPASVRPSEGTITLHCNENAEKMSGVPRTSPAPPVVIQAPISLVRFLNGTARFAVVATGAEPLEFQWKHGAEVVPGAHGPELYLPDLQWADAGDYTVVVSNRYGSAQATANLTLIEPTKFASVAVGLGPIGYWRFNETVPAIAYDYWGERDGRASAGVIAGMQGPVPNVAKGFDEDNLAFGFDGASGQIEVPPLNTSRAAMTIVAWIKPSGSQDDYDAIAFCQGGNTVAGLGFQRGGQLGYWWNNAPGTYNWASALYPAKGNWNFVALAVDLHKATVYLDDLQGFGLQSSANVSHHPPEEFDAPLHIGADAKTGRFFKGAIDEVVIYDRALTETEMRALRDAGVKGTLTHTQVAIVEQPRSQTIMAGTSHVLRARVIGTPPLSFQWKKNGQPILSATRSSIVFSPATESHTGTYQLFVTQGSTTIATEPVNLTVSPVPSCLNLADGLVLHLKFDGDFADGSGRSNHGIARGKPEIVPGKIGTGALKCSTTVKNGAVTEANYLSLGTPGDLDFGSGQNFSVAFWVKFSDNPGDLPFLANNSLSTGDVGITIAPSYEHASWSWGLNDALEPRPWPGIAICGPTTTALNDGNWHHVVHVFDRAGDAVTWIDGVKANATPIGAAFGWNFRTRMEWTIGQAGGSYPQQGTLLIDDLGIWRRSLNEYEALSIYILGERLGLSYDCTAPPKVTVQIRPVDGIIVIEWPVGILESATSVRGPWTPVPDVYPPKVQLTPLESAKFYRVRL